MRPTIRRKTKVAKAEARQHELLMSGYEAMRDAEYETAYIRLEAVIQFGKATLTTLTGADVRDSSILRMTAAAKVHHAMALRHTGEAELALKRFEQFRREHKKDDFGTPLPFRGLKRVTHARPWETSMALSRPNLNRPGSAGDSGYWISTRGWSLRWAS